MSKPATRIKRSQEQVNGQTAIKRVALYARVSTDEQVKEGTSLKSQLIEFRRMSEYEGLQIYKEYVEEGKSGTTDNRPQLKCLMADAEAKRFDIVAVTKLDRFFRKLMLLLEYTKRLKELGIAFISKSEKIDTSNNNDTGTLFLSILGSIAEFESGRMMDRVREGRNRTLSEGKWAAGQPLYGYRYNPTTKKLEFREDEAPTVRRIFNNYIYDRLGVERIARNLNQDKIQTRQKAKQWYAGAVRDIIKHPVYKGDHPLGIELPAIIDPALWELAQQRRKDNHKLHRRNGSPWLLQGMIRCGICNSHTLRCIRSHNVRRTYSCRGRLQEEKPNNDDKCLLKPIDADWLESAVWQKITDALSDPEHLIKALDDYIAKLKARSAELEKIIKPVEEDLAQVKESKARLAEKWVRGALSRDYVEQEKSKYDAEEIRLSNIRQEIDPAQIEELENTRTWLSFWQKSKRELDLRLSFIADGAPDEAEQQKNQASKVAAVLLGMADIEDFSLRDITGSHTTKRQLLDYLQLKIIPFLDRIELRAALPIKNIDIQEYNPSSWSSFLP